MLWPFGIFSEAVLLFKRKEIREGTEASLHSYMSKKYEAKSHCEFYTVLKGPRDPEYCHQREHWDFLWGLTLCSSFCETALARLSGHGLFLF